MDYECLSPTDGRVHDEHAVLARTPGGLVLLTAHSHAPVATVLRETEPGHFPAAEGDAPFPMAIRLEVPEPGHLRYLWSYGMPGEEPQLRDVGDLKLVERLRPPADEAQAASSSSAGRMRPGSTLMPGPMVERHGDALDVAALGRGRLGPLELVEHGPEVRRSGRRGSKLTLPTGTCTLP